MANKKLSKDVAETAGHHNKLKKYPNGKKLGGKGKKKGSRSEDRIQHKPRLEDRGAGSSYAYAVAVAMDEAKELKGSEADSHLGKKKRTLDPSKYTGRELLYEGKKRQ